MKNEEVATYFSPVVHSTSSSHVLSNHTNHIHIKQAVTVGGGEGEEEEEVEDLLVDRLVLHLLQLPSEDLHDVAVLDSFDVQFVATRLGSCRVEM